MAGELNGTDVGVAIDATGGGTFADIGGITTNSFTLNNGAIDITNKSSASWRELLAGEGLQSVDLTFECLFSSDAAFANVKTSALAKTILPYQIVRGSDTLQGSFMITSFAETSPDNDKVTASVSLQSSGPVTGL
jgi:TP901-1 family phage major tail protein